MQTGKVRGRNEAQAASAGNAVQDEASRSRGVNVRAASASSGGVRRAPGR